MFPIRLTENHSFSVTYVLLNTAAVAVKYVTVPRPIAIAFSGRKSEDRGEDRVCHGGISSFRLQNPG